MNKEIIQKLKNYDYVVGVDEVGRGPIAGPVMVADFSVNRQNYDEVFKRLSGITDSKKLTEKKREHFADIIKELEKDGRINIAISSVSAKRIDQKGISNALRSALNSSVKKVSEKNDKLYVYLDGSLYADDIYDQETIIKGDSKNWLISAASVIAKVTRDNYMVQVSKKYPEYSFEQHKGYGTKMHYEKIKEFGVCEIHRKTWIKTSS